MNTGTTSSPKSPLTTCSGNRNRPAVRAPSARHKSNVGIWKYGNGRIDELTNHPSDLGGQRDTKVTRKDTKTQQDSLPRLSDERNNTVAEIAATGMSPPQAAGAPVGKLHSCRRRISRGDDIPVACHSAKRTVLCLLRCGIGLCCFFVSFRVTFVSRAKRSRRARVTRLGEKKLKIFFPFPVPCSPFPSFSPNKIGLFNQTIPQSNKRTIFSNPY